MSYTLDQASIEVMRASQDQLLLGVLDIDRGIISIYLADRVCDEKSRRFRGHEEMLLKRAIAASGVLGFSFQVKQTKLFRFYRNSILNQNHPFSCLTPDEMDRIIAAMGLDRCDDFESYP